VGSAGTSDLRLDEDFVGLGIPDEGIRVFVAVGDPVSALSWLAL